MREKARSALEAAQNIHPLDLPRAADGVALGMGIIKKEEIDDEFTVFAGRTKVFRPGATSLPAPQAPPMMMTNSSSSGGGVSPDEAHVGHAQVGEWLSRQVPYVGYDPHYVPPIEPPPHPPLSAPHQQNPQRHQHHQQPHQHQHQHHQYHQQQYPTYAPEQPQYTLEATHSIPQYMTTSYPYSQQPLPPQPPHSSLTSSSTSTTTPSPLGLHGSHALPHHHPQHQHQHHPEDLAELRSYAAVALAPQTELSQLGLAANGSRVNETWMSFMHQHSGLLNGSSTGGQHL